MNSFESNEMEKGAIKKEKKKYKKSPKTAQECKVCGRVARFNYYKIQSCEACKQFFRRTMVDKRTFICTKSNSCVINKEMKSCRACRLDKCLMEGMDPTMVEAEPSADLSQFIQTLYERREFLQQQRKKKERKFCPMDTETVIENGTSDKRNEDVILVCIERLEKLLEVSGNPPLIPILERVEKLEKLVERLVEGENRYGHRFGDVHHTSIITSAPTASNGIQWGQPPRFAGTDDVSQMITEAIINSKQHFVIFN